MRQKKFADEYIISGNIYHSLIKAGYSEAYAKADGCKLLANPSVKQYIDEQFSKMNKNKIASAEEILIYLTNVMRGLSESEIVVMVGKGEGISKPKRIKKRPDEKERLQAARELAKRIIDTQAEESKETKLDKLLQAVEGEFIE